MPSSYTLTMLNRDYRALCSDVQEALGVSLAELAASNPRLTLAILEKLVETPNGGPGDSAKPDEPIAVRALSTYLLREVRMRAVREPLYVEVRVFTLPSIIQMLCGLLMSSRTVLWFQVKSLG